MNRNLLFSLLLLTQLAPAMPRNPFQPLISPCDALIRQLDQWALNGVLSSEKGTIAVMRISENSWRRVTSGAELLPGVQVEAIDQQAISVTLPQDCEQPLYLWEIKGAKHGMDASDNSVGNVAVRKPR